MFKLSCYTDRTDFTDIDLTPKEAILAKCYDCCCYDKKEVKACTIKHCPLMKLKDMWLNNIGKKTSETDRRKFNTFGRS